MFQNNLEKLKLSNKALFFVKQSLFNNTFLSLTPLKKTVLSNFLKKKEESMYYTVYFSAFY